MGHMAYCMNKLLYLLTNKNARTVGKQQQQQKNNKKKKNKTKKPKKKTKKKTHKTHIIVDK